MFLLKSAVFSQVAHCPIQTNQPAVLICFLLNFLSSATNKSLLLTDPSCANFTHFLNSPLCYLRLSLTIYNETHFKLFMGSSEEFNVRVCSPTTFLQLKFNVYHFQYSTMYIIYSPRHLKRAVHGADCWGVV